MKDLARYGAILVLVVFVVMRVVEVREDSTPKATQAVAGVVKQLSETEVGFLFQLDNIRKKALRKLRGHYPKNSFTPPSWFLSAMDEVSKSAGIGEAHTILKDASIRLYKPQGGDHFEFGREAVRDAVSGSDEVKPDVCPDCNGTGKVGDGKVFTDCLTCKPEAGDEPKTVKVERKRKVPRLFDGRLLKRIFKR